MQTTDVTSSSYWSEWWSDHDEVADPIRAHWPEFGTRGFFLRAVERHTGPLTGKSVVEIGGALSNFLLAMAKWRGIQAAAIDYCAPALARTKRMFAANGCEIDCICSDVFAIKDGNYDLVTHWGVLEHQKDPFSLIEKSTQLCAPGGAVILSMPQMRGPGSWLWKREFPENWNLHIYHSDKSIIEAFAKCGWSCKPVFWGPPMIRITGLEPKLRIAKIAAKAQFWASQIDRFRLSPYHRGLPYVSMSRGFVARAG
jgi:hypothetical protein